MSQETDFLNQKAVVWDHTGYDSAGDTIVSHPRQIQARWEFRRQQLIDENGAPIAVDATVFVDQEIAVDSIIWKGAIEKVPDPIKKLYIVVFYEETPDINCDEFERILGIKKFRDKLPEIESA